MTSTLSASEERSDDPEQTESGVEQAEPDTQAELDKAAKRAKAERIGRMVAMFLFPFLLVTMMITGYLAAMHHTAPHNLPIAVAGPAAEAVRFAQALEAADPDAVDVRVVATAADAEQLVLDREVSGAVVLAQQGESGPAKLYTAGAAGASQSGTVTQLLAPQLIGQGIGFSAEDLAPLPSNDSAGLAPMFMTTALMLAGYMPLSLMLSSAPHLLRLRRFLPLLAGWSALTAFLVWFVAGPVLGAVHGHTVEILGLGFLTVAAVGLVQLFFTRIFGPMAVLVGMLFIMVLGVPASNMGMSIHTLPSLYPWLHNFLPAPAIGESLRSVIYFGGNGLGGHVIVLVIGAAAGLGLTALLDFVKRRRNPDAAGPEPTMFSLTGGRPARKPVLYTTMAFFPLAMLVLMLSTMLGAMYQPAPKDMPVAVVGATTEQAQMMVTGLEQNMTGLFDLRALDDADAAREQVRDRDIVAAYVLPSAATPNATLITNGAAGMSQQQVVGRVFGQVAAGSGMTLETVDLAPLGAEDTTGTVSLYVAMGWIMSGFMIIVVAANAFPPAMRPRNLLAVVAGWSVFMSVVLWLIADPLIGAVDGHFLKLVGAGIVAIFCTAMFTTVFVRLIGLLAVIPVIAVLMFLGVPASGGAMSIYMEPEVFRFLHEVLPMPAAVESVRSILYFGGDSVGGHLITFLIWGAISLVFVFVVDRLRPVLDIEELQPARPPAEEEAEKSGEPVGASA
ncbi:ABC transporter permease [Nocardia higoensis]|uniref:ABC transporter permease n=1 Tax=Nocardia higoensis TaxID=228599 RepID=UPI0002F4439D|nr:ABC transporter permease [Nocardia higoensis]